ncbi:MAG TPA: cyclase family protein [Actinomycetota bacterium]|nr:cyclase family protein [Actinomycetota bacterium]
MIDVSLPIGPDLLVWPGDPPVDVVPRLRLARGDPANVSELRMGTHTGTHVDPPNHFVEGSTGIDRVPLAVLMGRAIVVDARHLDRPIEPTDFDRLEIPQSQTRVLLRTANSDLWRRPPAPFPDRYACLTPETARMVVDRGIRLIGVDFLSVEQKGATGHPVHHILLENGVVIVEGLNLGEAEPGEYTLACLPLKIVDGDGGPARALLVPV